MDSGRYRMVKKIGASIFFVGIIDKKKAVLKIYNTSTLSFIFNENQDASLVDLVFAIAKADIGRPSVEKIKRWPKKNKGDGNKYLVNLGTPLITISNKDIYKKN